MLREEIDELLAEKRVGIAGVSRTGGKFSNKVFEKLKEAGYEVHPVHPQMESLGGDTCVASVRELPGEVRALMVVASPSVCAKVLADVRDSDINRIWVFSGFRNRPDIEAEIRRLKDSGRSVISCLCPFMFLEPVGTMHSVHRFFVRLLGKYPK